MTASTGLHDSEGVEIRVGDLVTKTTDCNASRHGACAYYRVIQRGLTPVLVYERSDSGQVLPAGMTGGILCDEYDLEEFIRSADLSAIRPVSTLLVVREASKSLGEGSGH